MPKFAKDYQGLTGGLVSNVALWRVPEGKFRGGNNVRFRGDLITEVREPALFATGFGIGGDTGNVTCLVPTTGNNLGVAVPGMWAGTPANIYLINREIGGITVQRGVTSMAYTGVGVGLSQALALKYSGTPPFAGTYNVRIKAGATTFEMQYNGGGYSGSFAVGTVGAGGTLSGLTVHTLASLGFTAGDLWTITAVDNTILVAPPLPGVGPNRTMILQTPTAYFAINQASRLMEYIISDGLWRVVGNNSLEKPYVYGSYLELFFNHLMVGGIGADPAGLFQNRVKWSDNFNLDTFGATVTNEADFYDFPVNEEDGLVSGLTGMRNLRNQCIMYAKNQIWALDYVGLPLVMQRSTIRTDLGNEFANGLIALGNFHYFWGNGNVWQFDGATINSIGDEISNRFYAALNASRTNDPFVSRKVTGWADPFTQELRWSFDSDGTVDGGNNVIVYSTRYQKWWFEQTPARHVAFLGRTASLHAYIGGAGPDLREIPAEDLVQNVPSSALNTSNVLTGLFTLASPAYVCEIESIWMDVQFNVFGLVTFPTTASATLQIIHADNSINRTAGDFVVNGFVAGQCVILKGFTANQNDAKFTIVSVTPTKMVLSGNTLLDEGPTAATRVDQIGSMQVWVQTFRSLGTAIAAPTSDTDGWVYCGRYTGYEPEGRLSFPKVAGTYFRFWFGGYDAADTSANTPRTPVAPNQNLALPVDKDPYQNWQFNSFSVNGIRPTAAGAEN